MITSSKLKNEPLANAISKAHAEKLKAYASRRDLVGSPPVVSDFRGPWVLVSLALLCGTSLEAKLKVLGAADRLPKLPGRKALDEGLTTAQATSAKEHSEETQKNLEQGIGYQGQHDESPGGQESLSFAVGNGDVHFDRENLEAFADQISQSDQQTIYASAQAVTLASDASASAELIASNAQVYAEPGPKSGKETERASVYIKFDEVLESSFNQDKSVA